MHRHRPIKLLEGKIQYPPKAPTFTLQTFCVYILWVAIQNCIEMGSGGGGFRCHRKQKRYDHSVVTAAMSGAEKSRACRFPQVFQFTIYSYTLLKSVTLKALAAAATWTTILCPGF